MEKHHLFDRVLVYIEGPEAAREALRAGLEIARRFGSEIFCLSVFDPSFLQALGAFTPGAVISPAVIDERASEWHRFVEGAVRSLLQEGRRPVHVLREIGSAAERIVETASAEHVDLIVIGSGETGRFRRMMRESISSGVVHHAPCPVLILRE